jgi:hypothetical protein
MRRAFLAVALALAGAAGAAEPVLGDWQGSVTPYLLLPGVDADFGIDAGGGAPEVGAGPSGVLSMINFVVMLKGEARRGRTFVFADWMYLDLGNVDSVVRAVEFPDGTVPVGASLTLDSDASFDAFMVMGGGGWRALDAPRGNIDLYGGLRTLNFSSSLRWTLTGAITSPGGGYSFPTSGELASNSETWDALLGARGAWRFAEHWSAFGFGDHGWGHGSESWQWGFGLRWQPRAVSLEVAWRELGWLGLGDDNSGTLRLYGPAFGATFTF